MHFNRKTHYEASVEAGNLDYLSRKLSADLRKHVRKLEHYAPFSRDWLAMVDSLLHISNIALMEHRVPRDDEAATLWEGEELTVRFLLEEGKLNLCVRLMHEFKKRAREHDADEALASRAAAEVNLERSVLESRALVFEQSLSVLLKCAFEHVEPLQTVDMASLLEHAAEVLEHAANSPKQCELSRTQEMLVPLYLAAIVSRLDSIDETRVLALVKACALLPRALHFACVLHARLPGESLEAVGLFALGLLESEDFKTHRDLYLPGPQQPRAPLPSSGVVGVATDAKAELCQLKELLLHEASPETKGKFALLVREAEAIERRQRLNAGT